MNLITKTIYFYKRKIHPGFRIGRNELVVDIGSGDKPFWRADVFFDNLMLAGGQRVTGIPVVANLGLFVDGNLPKTPFKDKAFDFSFCAHLLEHVDDPAACMRELMRISKRGYIEVPGGAHETIGPFNTHLWFVFRNNNKLVFIRKSTKEHQAISAHAEFYKKTKRSQNDPFIRLYWNGAIDFEVINEISENEKHVPKETDSFKVTEAGLYLKVVRQMRKYFYLEKDISIKRLL